MEIAQLLLRIEDSRDKLNPLELQELRFFREEFALEVTKSQSHEVTTGEVTESQSHEVTGEVTESQSHEVASLILPSTSRRGVGGEVEEGSRGEVLEKERWWLFAYTDDQFALRVSPLAGYGVRSVAGETNTIRWPGLKFFGYGGDWFGASFEYVDFGETGSNTDRNKRFSPITGAYVNLQSGSTFEYSDVKGSVSFSWKWGNISIIKDYQTWGHGQFGQVILSTKAPSFTQIRFHANPVSWFRFNYFQGWVNSLIYDSSAAVWSHTESVSPTRIIPYKDKYVVANLATFSVMDELDLSIGNAFVYGPNFRFETLIPFLYST